jgi:hypothetical protein
MSLTAMSDQPLAESPLNVVLADYGHRLCQLYYFLYAVEEQFQHKFTAEISQYQHDKTA